MATVKKGVLVPAGEWWSTYGGQSAHSGAASGKPSTAWRGVNCETLILRRTARRTAHSMMQGKLARPICPSRRALAGMPRSLVQRLEIDFEMAFDLDEAAWPQRRVLDFQVLLDKILRWNI